MNSIRSSHAQPGTQATRETPASAAQSIAATHFKPHFVVGGGDCLFHALCMGSTNQPAVPVSMEHIMNLRQDAANYVAQHRSVLMTHPSLGGEAGVNQLYGLLITQGQWNENAGDLVPPILARVLGREIRILEPTQHGNYYDANENRIFRPQDTDTGLPPAKPDTGQPPIYLAHISRTHYEYLEPRNPQANLTSESIKIKPLLDSIECPSDTSSLESMSTTDWFDLLLDEEKNNLTDNAGYPTPPKEVPFGRVSYSSLESYSSKGLLKSLAAQEKNSPTNNVDQPSRKRPPNTVLVPEQKTTLTSRGNRSVTTRVARTEIMNAFTETMNNRTFDALAQEEQTAEVMRVSRKTGYNPSAVLTTLAGGGNRSVTTHAARIEIMNAFIETANNLLFDALTKEEKTAKVMRISRKTGYNPSAVLTTLTGEGNKAVRTQIARTEIINAFTETANNRPFKRLTQEEKTAEVMRISRKTGYNPSAVLTTLSGGGNRPVTTHTARTEIMNAFSEANNLPFNTLRHEEKTAEVMRISRKTGYNTSGVLTTLTGTGTMQVGTYSARTKIKDAYYEANNLPFNTLTKKQKDTEVTRISRKTGYRPSGVLTTLIVGGKQSAEPVRISRRTGHTPAGSMTTRTGEGKKQVATQAASNEITKTFTEAHNRPFEALTKEEQTAEVTRISRQTGYRPSGIRTTLNGGGNRPVETQMARSEITKAFTDSNNRPFDALTQEEQTAEAMRISRKTKYRSSAVHNTLNGGGNKQVKTAVARNEITEAFTEGNDRPFDALTKKEQTIEVTRISRKTGYNPSGVRTTLAGGGNKQVKTEIARNEITKAFTGGANNRTFETLTKEERASEVARISRKTGYRPSGVLLTLTEHA